MIVGLIVLFLVCYGVYWLYERPKKYWKKKEVCQVDPWIAVLESVIGPKPFYDIVIDTYNKFSDKRYVGSYQFFTPALFVRDLDLIKQITVKDFEYFTDHPSFLTNEADTVFNNNLFSLRGEKWKDMRSTLSPAFTSSKMRTMYTLMQETADNFSKHFYEEAKDKIVELEMRSAFSKYTNDVIANCAFGVQCDSLKNENNEFYKMAMDLINPSALRVLKLFSLGFLPFIKKFFKITMFPASLTNFFKSLVVETMAVREKNGIIRPDMIHLLMEAKKGNLRHENEKDSDTGFATVEESSIGKSIRKIEFTDDVIAAQAMIFFFAGFSTTSTTLSFLAYYLAVYPDVQLKLQKEIDNVLKEFSGKISYEGILKMKYLDQVVSETLRLYSPGFVIARDCVKDYLIKATREGEKDLLIEKGVIVNMPACGIHRDPQYFPNPEKFDPERFSDENKVNIVPGSYMPFGAGPRNCIGSRFALLETKALIVNLLRDFDIVPVKKTVIPLKLAKVFDLAIKGGCWLGLKRRQAQA